MMITVIRNRLSLLRNLVCSLIIFIILSSSVESADNSENVGQFLQTQAVEEMLPMTKNDSMVPFPTHFTFSAPPINYEEVTGCSTDTSYTESRYLGCFLRSSIDPLYPALQSIVINNPSNITILIQQTTGSDCKSSLPSNQSIANITYIESSSSTIQLLNVNCTGQQCCFRIAVPLTGDSYGVHYRVYRYMDQSTQKQPLTPGEVAGIVIGSTIGTFAWIFFSAWSCMCLCQCRCIPLSEASKRLCYVQEGERCTVRNLLYFTANYVILYIFLSIFGLPGVAFLLFCEICCGKNLLKDFELRITNYLFPKSNKLSVPPTGLKDPNRPTEDFSVESGAKLEETVNPSAEAIIVPNPSYPSKSFVVGGGIISVKNAETVSNIAMINSSSSRSLRNLMDQSTSSKTFVKNGSTDGVVLSLVTTNPSVVVKVESDSSSPASNATFNTYYSDPIPNPYPSRTMAERIQSSQAYLATTSYPPLSPMNTTVTVDPRLTTSNTTDNIDDQSKTNTTQIVSNWR